MTDDDTSGFFRNLSGLATEYVRQKRKSLQSTPTTNVDSTGTSTRYNFQGQDITWDDLRDIKDIRDSGGQVAQLMEYKALLNFGEGAEIHVEDEEHTELVDGEELTLTEWLERQFPDLDLLVLDLGTDALWYPSAYGEIRETVTGDFKEALPAEPWTIIPITDESGEIVAYRQRTKQPGGGYREETLSVDDVWNIAINKASARDKTGISEVLRNREEIQAFKENEQAINNAIELHGFPQRHVKVGREEGAPVSDDDLRRVRTIFDPRTSDANTAYFTGQDVQVEALEAEQFEYSAIHEMDMRNLTTALGLPLEAGNVGSDGLGSGKPAELRFSLLKLAIKANQRSFSTQFVEEVMRPVIRDYSPFDHTANVTLDIGDPLEDIGEMADVIQQIGDYMTNNQVARKLDLPEPEDDEIGESYRSPADIEKSEAGDPVDEGPFGGMFEDANRTLQETPVVSFDTVGGDPFEDEDQLMAFLEDLDEAAEGTVYVGRVPWPEVENPPVHDKPIRAVGISEQDANEVFARHEDGAVAIGGASEVDDVASIFMSEGEEGNANSGHHGITQAELEAAPDWDQPMLEMLQGVTDPESDPNRSLVSYASSGTPEFVLERIREAIMSGAMFSEYDDIPSDRLMDLRQTFADELGNDNFTLDSITDQLMEFEADLSRDEAQRIARTESSAVLNKSREIAYEQEDEAQDSLFYWTGASLGDPRQTEACAWLIRQTNPFEGGTPVPMKELKQMIEQAPEHDDDMSDELARPESFVVHPNERSTFVKAPENWRDL